MRRTLKSSIEVNGTGLHGGQAVRMVLSPAAAGNGIRFLRTDVSPEKAEIPARFDLVSDTQLCTKLTNDHNVSVGTVEHVMAALAGTGVTDCTIHLDGPEVPIADGSSAPFVAAIQTIGLADTGGVVEAVRVLAPVRVEDGDKWAVLLPADRFEMSFAIDFADPAIGTQSQELSLVNGAFSGELADCRTFGHLQEVEYLRSLGLARGGSLKNAIVVDKGRVLNPEGLRRPDEFVRHKMLDAVGDLALAGFPIIGRFEAFKGGHGLTNKLLHELFASETAWALEPLRYGQTPGGTIPAKTLHPDARLLAV